eukprot:3222946-Amphidinium_carterae.1
MAEISESVVVERKAMLGELTSLIVFVLVASLLIAMIAILTAVLGGMRLRASPVFRLLVGNPYR